MLSLFAAKPALATHIVGGEVSYVFKGNAGDSNKYQVKLTIYEDCLNGSPGAIAADNPAFIAVFAGSKQIKLDSAQFDTSFLVPANFNNSCVTNTTAICLLKKTFLFNFTLAPNSEGYTIAYQ